MKLLTGNDLASGDSIWWSGRGWSRHVADAVDVGAGADAAALLAAETAALRVNGGYVVDAEQGPDGPCPTHIKERIRAAGPTVRPDLAIDSTIPIVKA